MNYRHAYHAGNFADVFKHTLLIILLTALNRKPAPWCYFDSHAGAGLYDLQGAEVRRGDEAAGGIHRLWPLRATAPAPVAELCSAVAAVNPGLPADALPRFYPGSPLIAAGLARPQDRLVLAELRSDEVQLLRTHLHRDAHAAIHARDGYEMLRALTPPAERRGLALLDPTFELPTEFVQMLQALSAAYQRWPEGVYALWYPRKDGPATRRLERELLRLKPQRMLRADFRIAPEDTPQFGACSLALINPPWQSEHAMQVSLAFLRDALAPQAGSYHLHWLTTASLDK
ncbi:MAG TPA: 23S rRNA (adenine(2030)-N(6))-methyltransferase RlmJ [Gammaproteobacteria bacterium]|nr:23S rRNA (adenine(2030)-N(6))-methyltransferase RlmJ [Gammaproteobacteria bacterium]